MTEKKETTEDKVDKYKVVIMCAGSGKRWEGDKPKQLYPIQGRPNIVRTIDLLKQKDIHPSDIIVTVNKDNISYFPQDLNLVTGSSAREIDRFRNTFAFIRQLDRVIFLYGDVVYKTEDLDTVLSQSTNAFLGRNDYNNLTKKPWGEILAIVIYDVNRFIQDVNSVADRYEKGILAREIGWEVYKTGSERYRFVKLSLRTDDFDTIEEYKILAKMYS